MQGIELVYAIFDSGGSQRVVDPSTETTIVARRRHQGKIITDRDLSTEAVTRLQFLRSETGLFDRTSSIEIKHYGWSRGIVVILNAHDHGSFEDVKISPAEAMDPNDFDAPEGTR